MIENTLTQEEYLRKQIKLGNDAERAYKLYLKDFIKSREDKVLQSFKECDISNMNILAEIKRLDMVIQDLKSAILSDIAIGKNAAKELGEL